MHTGAVAGPPNFGQCLPSPMLSQLEGNSVAAERLGGLFQAKQAVYR